MFCCCRPKYDGIADQLWYGVRLLAQKQATNFGDGDSLVAFIRDSIGDYHLQGKVIIVQNACARMVVAQQYIYGFLGEVQERLHLEGLPGSGGLW